MDLERLLDLERDGERECDRDLERDLERDGDLDPEREREPDRERDLIRDLDLLERLSLRFILLSSPLSEPEYFLNLSLKLCLLIEKQINYSKIFFLIKKFKLNFYLFCGLL